MFCSMSAAEVNKRAYRLRYAYNNWCNLTTIVLHHDRRHHHHHHHYQWRRLHRARGARAPTFTNDWVRGALWVEEQNNDKKLTKLCWPSRRRSPKRLENEKKTTNRLLEPKKWRARPKNIFRCPPPLSLLTGAPSFKFVSTPLHIFIECCRCNSTHHYAQHLKCSKNNLQHHLNMRKQAQSVTIVSAFIQHP